MSEALLKYYNRELAYLRRQGAERIGQSPHKIGGGTGRVAANGVQSLRVPGHRVGQRRVDIGKAKSRHGDVECSKDDRGLRRFQRSTSSRSFQ